MAFTVRVGTAISGVGAIAPTAPAGHAANDIDLLIIEHSGELADATLTTANGFALLTGASIRTGVGPAGNVAAITVYWRRWDGAAAVATIADQGNHQHAFMLSIAGCITTGNPWDQVATNTQLATASVSITGATATVTGTIVVACSAGSLPDAAAVDIATEFSAAANANLTSVTERKDSTTLDGNGGSLLCITGELAGASAWGATTATAVDATATRANTSFNLKPAAGAAAASLVPAHRPCHLLRR